MSRLGETQRDVLWSLIQHKEWHSGSGWHWNNFSETVRIMESLVKRGLVDKAQEKRPWSVTPITVYTINDAGRAALRETQL